MLAGPRSGKLSKLISVILSGAELWCSSFCDLASFLQSRNLSTTQKSKRRTKHCIYTHTPTSHTPIFYFKTFSKVALGTSFPRSRWCHRAKPVACSPWGRSMEIRAVQSRPKGCVNGAESLSSCLYGPELNGIISLLAVFFFFFISLLYLLCDYQADVKH